MQHSVYKKNDDFFYLSISNKVIILSLDEADSVGRAKTTLNINILNNEIILPGSS
jgi:hypothetical protein